MADISYVQKGDLEDSDKALEIEEDDRVDENLSPDTFGTGICSVGASGDEGKRDEELLKLEEYVSSLGTNFTRQQIGRVMVYIFRIAAEYESQLDVNEVMHSIKNVIQDPDTQVRTDLLEQIPLVTVICEKAPHLFGDVLNDHFLDIITKYLTDNDNQVRGAAQTAVLTLLKGGFLHEKAIEEKICPVIKFLLCRQTDFLITGLSLISKVAPFIGKLHTQMLFLNKFTALCADEEFIVRRTCVLHFGEICASVPWRALYRILFPLFVNLSKDKAWGVRKACVDVMMPVACCLPLQFRRSHFAKIMATHLNDESKWVRISAFQILGPFISTFAKEFTEVTYNQHGELVFTRQQDARFSVRYFYEGIFPMKCSIRSHMLDAEDPNSQNESSYFEYDDDKSEEDHISTMKAYTPKIQTKYNWQQQPVDDTDKYNQFLYYYIPPVLPLDEKLVEAARKSTAQKNINRKTKTTKVQRVHSEIKVQEIVPWNLVDSFLSMAKPEQYADMNADIPHHCAFSFPAVVLTVGRENWPYLKQTYQMLASANQWKVRRTLASSIHEIAMILGEELTATDLVPIFDGFIKDLDEVRIGVLKHLATFLKILQLKDRYQYLRRLKEFLATDNECNWRFREELAIQLLEVLNLFSPVDIERVILSLSMELLGDKVAAVRHVALSLVTQIVAHLSDNEPLVTAFFQELRYFLGVYENKWNRRQMFAFVCAQLISTNAISGDRFSEEMLPILLELSMDKVPNVRLAVARTLATNVVPMGPDWLGVEQAEKVERRLEEMRWDPDRDVRVLAGGTENPVLDVYKVYESILAK